MSSSDSSFSSSFSSSFGAASGAAPPAAAAGAAPTAGAPPAPMLERSSLTFFPSRAFASSDAQIGSTSTLAAEVRAMIFSDCMAYNVSLYMVSPRVI